MSLFCLRLFVIFILTQSVFVCFIFYFFVVSRLLKQIQNVEVSTQQRPTEPHFGSSLSQKFLRPERAPSAVRRRLLSGDLPDFLKVTFSKGFQGSTSRW